MLYVLYESYAHAYLPHALFKQVLIHIFALGSHTHFAFHFCLKSFARCINGLMSAFAAFLLVDISKTMFSLVVQTKLLYFQFIYEKSKSSCFLYQPYISY